jgi:pSer/pThr/pTyr-binding forkhead associated (FHA) protein
MAKLVLLSAGMTGRTHELKVDKTTIGRVEDNTFQIAEPSVSSHHCEVFLRGTDVVVRDLNSTNGTYINGEKITETILKAGQVLRLGQIEMRLETESTPSSAAPSTPASSTPPPTSPAKKPLDQTMVMQRGVSLEQLEQGRAGGIGTAAKGFSKKDDKANKIIWIVAGSVGLVIVLVLVYVFLNINR